MSLDELWVKSNSQHVLWIKIYQGAASSNQVLTLLWGLLLLCFPWGRFLSDPSVSSRCAFGPVLRWLFLSVDLVSLNALIHLWIMYAPLTLKYKFPSQHSEDLSSQLESFSWTFLQQQKTKFLKLNSLSSLSWFPKHLILLFHWQGPLLKAVQTGSPCAFSSPITTTPHPHRWGSQQFCPLNSLSYFLSSLSTLLFSPSLGHLPQFPGWSRDIPGTYSCSALKLTHPELLALWILVTLCWPIFHLKT